MRKTARDDLIECVGSWPGVLLRELIDAGELNHSKAHVIAVVGRLRGDGLLEPVYPARLRIRPGWLETVEPLYRRDRDAAAAIAAGAQTYRQLEAVTGRSLNSLYHSGARLARAGAVYRSRALFLTAAGQAEYLKARKRLTG